MKKWLIAGGFLGVLAIVAVLGILATGVFAQGAASQAAITPEQAQAAALAANPGASVAGVDQDEENGALVYEVKLDNGLEVQVDASSGAILGADQEEADSGAGDADNVQEEIQQANDTDQGGNDLDNVQQEFESQADDAQEILGAQETPGVEDAPGQ
jgi:hypothetical protein